ncbi:hypothetical protein RJ035_002569 [Blastomyces gilchristii]
MYAAYGISLCLNNLYGRVLFVEKSQYRGFEIDFSERLNILRRLKKEAQTSDNKLVEAMESVMVYGVLLHTSRISHPPETLASVPRSILWFDSLYQSAASYVFPGDKNYARRRTAGRVDSSLFLQTIHSPIPPDQPSGHEHTGAQLNRFGACSPHLIVAIVIVIVFPRPRLLSQLVAAGTKTVEYPELVID